MTEQELRALVREAIARNTASPVGHVLSDVAPGAFRRHVSHAMFTVPAGADSDGACLIEPAVRCNHCGFCKSYGH